MPPRTARYAAIAALFLFALLNTAWAGKPAPGGCEGLDPGKQAIYDGLLRSLHPYDACDETLAVCLEKTPSPPLAARLAADVCRQVKKGKTAEEIEHAMLRRAQSMTPGGKLAVFQLDEAMRAGEANAPVTLVVYACTRCPFCRVMVLNLHREITQGSLKGKANLYFRPFPLKDHIGALEGGLGLVAAARMGHFWPYLTRVYEQFGAFAIELLPVWAGELGMDPAAFAARMADEATRESLNVSKQEGVRHRVTATPTLFINGRKCVYDQDMETLLDLVDEEIERTASEPPSPPTRE